MDLTNWTNNLNLLVYDKMRFKICIKLLTKYFQFIFKTFVAPCIYIFMYSLSEWDLFTIN